MSVPLIDVRVHDPEMLSAIQEKIRSHVDSAYFIGGEEVRLFAEEFAAFCGGGTCVPVANGTDALILALRALNIGPGDEVITVPFTFIATAEAISAVGATVKFVDIDPKNYNMDVPQMKKAIGPKTKAVLPVHLFGHPADMDPIMTIAVEHGLSVVEDAAQAHGAEYKNKRVGSLGHVGCFSFYPTKNLGGFGDGGAIVTRSPEVAAKVAKIADHGRAAQYFHDIEGVNSRLDAIQAAVLRLKLRKLNQWNDRRRTIALEYGKTLRQNSFATPPHVEAYAKHVFHLYCVESSHRDELLAFLREGGIGAGVYYPLPLHLQPAYARLGHKKGDFPVSERLSARIMALPMFPSMTDANVSEVCARLTAFSPKGR